MSTGRAARFGLRLVGLVALLLYQSLLWIEGPPPAARVAVIAFGLLALLRPGHALLVVAGLAPLSVALFPALNVSPIRGAEALALGFAAGWCLRGGAPRSRTPHDTLLERVSLLFALIVVAACVESLTPRVVTWSGPQDPATGLWEYFTRRYLAPGGIEVVHACSLLGFGMLVAHSTSVLSRGDATLADRLVRMTVAGGLGAAGLSLFRAGSALMRSVDPMSLLARIWNGDVRLSLHVQDVNAAGSYFALVTMLTVGLALGPRRSSRLWLLASVVSALALLVSGSRSALVACLLVAGLGVLGVWMLRGRIRMPRQGLAVGAAVAAVVLLIVAVTPQTQADRQMLSSMWIRYYFAQTSARMIASAPVFGVGVTRYMPRSNQFMPPELRRYYARENAHNQFLQVTAELGLIAGALFLLVILVAFVRGLRTLRSPRASPYLFGIVGGLGAFLITCLSGHPLLYSQVAIPFWVVVGLTSGLSLQARDADSGTPPASLAWYREGAAWAGATVAIVVLASLPIRVADAAREPILSGVSRGFHDWEVDSRGRRFRWTTGQATFYVPSGIRIVDVPLRAWNPVSGQSTDVAIFVNRALANRLNLSGPEWTSARVELPARAPDRYWRVDLKVSPAARPVDVNPRSTDDRLLGVRVGEIQFTPDPGNRSPR